MHDLSVHLGSASTSDANYSMALIIRDFGSLIAAPETMCMTAPVFHINCPAPGRLEQGTPH